MTRSLSTPRTAGLLGLVATVATALSLTAWWSSSEGAAPDDERLGSDTPVVLIVLDELPTANLLTWDGKRINADRYPRIARFVRGATWYRDNVAAGDFTAWAVPGILTGNTVNELTIPTAEAQPNNLFTLLGPGREVHSMETVTELCPVEICPDGNQGEAPDAKRADDFIKAKFKPFAPAELKEWIEGIPQGPGTLSFVHVEVPHAPLRFIPSGQAYKPGPLIMPTDLTRNGWTTGEAAVAFAQSRHLLQTGYADRLVGRILDRIRQNGDFDEAMIILTADHGISFDPDDLRRDVSETNQGATINPPLIIKYPGQEAGFVSTASTQNLDILPTIAAELGATIPATDGIPVSEADPDRVMTVGRDQLRVIKVTADEIRADRKQAVLDQYRRLGDRDLWHLGPSNHLIGKRPGRTRVAAGARHGLYVSDTQLRRADGSSNFVPSLVSGRLAGVAPNRVVALAWNGRIVGTSRTFEYLGHVQFGVMVSPKVMRRGRNAVTLYLVSPGGGLLRVPQA